MRVMVWLHTWLFVRPIRYMYVHAPGLGALGGWYGMKEADICAGFTKVSADHWLNNRFACAGAIDQRAHSLSTVLLGGLYFVALFRITYTLLYALDYILRRCAVELRDQWRGNLPAAGVNRKW